MNLLDLAQDLVKIPSITGDFKQSKYCIDYCKNYFKNYKNIIIKEIEYNGFPSILLSNSNDLYLDVLSIGHIDVVPAENKEMFIPKIVDGKMYGRGTLDMKSLVAVSMKMLEYVLKNNYSYKFGILIVSDEETGGDNGAKYWADNLKLKSKIILDFDNGEDINIMTRRRKGLFRVRLISKGVSAHGSTPWFGIDANENLINTLVNLRKYFPYYSKENSVENEWVTTFHTGVFRGGEAINIICPEAYAELDFRRIEEDTDDKLFEILKKCIVGNIETEIINVSNVVSTDLENKYIKIYTDIVENEIQKSVVYRDRCGATDSRYFTDKSEVIIQHGPNGFGIHSANEYVDIESLKKFEKIQEKFLDKLCYGEI